MIQKKEIKQAFPQLMNRASIGDGCYKVVKASGGGGR
jgi:hypothetical protein